MLAKELKIRTLKKQREFIEDQLSHADCRSDGDSSYWYVGHIYPEVIAHFEAEGYTVKEVHSDLLTALNKGNPIYFFTACDVKLTDEELQAAEDYGADPFDTGSESTETESDSTGAKPKSEREEPELGVRIRAIGMPGFPLGGTTGARPRGEDAILDDFFKTLFG